MKRIIPISNNKIFLQGIFVILFILFSTNLLNAIQNQGTTVFRCVDKCTIHVVFQVGVDGSDTDVSSVKTALENCWEGKNCKIPCEDDPTKFCKVTVDVQVKKWGDIPDGDKGKYHHVTMKKNANLPSTATVTPPNSGKSGTATFIRGKLPDEYCHELGHLGGLKDEYCGINKIASATWAEPSCPKPPGPDPCDCACPKNGRCTKPCTGSEGNIMAQIPAKVKCANILGIVALAGLNSCPKDPCCPDAQQTVPKNEDPPDNGETKKTDPTLRWRPANDVNTYTVMVYMDNHLENPYPIHRQMVVGDEYHVPPGVLNNYETYEWRVLNGEYTEDVYPSEEPGSKFTDFHVNSDHYYVNNASVWGEDYDGRSPWPTENNLHGPKESLQQAVNASQSDPAEHVTIEFVPNEEMPYTEQIMENLNDIKHFTIEGNGSQLWIESPCMVINSPNPVHLYNLNFISVYTNPPPPYTVFPFMVVQGMGNVIAHDCGFWFGNSPFSNLVPATCKQIEEYVYDGTDISTTGIPYPIGTGKFFFNKPPCYPNVNPDPVYWLDPTNIYAPDMAKIGLWEDQIKPVVQDASIGDYSKYPRYMYNGFNGFPGVKFEYDYGETHYGMSDILVTPYSKTITTEKTDKWDPDNTSKSLFVVFRPDQSLAPGNPPYYADGRQVLFEAGGPLSGYNIYFHEGHIIFGMWNRFERKYAELTSSDLYPLDQNGIYVAHLEYNGNTKQFRGSLSEGYNGTPGAVTAVSDIYPFQGLTLDQEYPNDGSGVGGASRTSYHDYNTGETYSDNFGGTIGDVMLFNSFFDVPPVDVYDYFGNRVGYNFDYPDPSVRPRVIGEWKLYEFHNLGALNANISDVYPNPTQRNATVELKLEDKQNVRIELYDAYGMRVMNIYEGSLNAGSHEFTIDGSGLASGFYIFKVTGKDFVESKKVIISK